MLHNGSNKSTYFLLVCKLRLMLQPLYFAHYGKSSHVKTICYRKHDFPPNFESKNFKNSSDKKAWTFCRKMATLYTATTIRMTFLLDINTMVERVILSILLIQNKMSKSDNIQNNSPRIKTFICLSSSIKIQHTNSENETSQINQIRLITSCSTKGKSFFHNQLF